MTRKESPPAAPTASRALTTVLVRDILAGSYAPGERLPTEREMAEEFRVSRHVVREALKRLETLGLVRIRQGSGVYTSDVLLTGGMELFEYILFNEQGDFERRVLDDLFVFWVLFIPDVLRLAAANRSGEQMRELWIELDKRAAALENPRGLLDVHQRIMRLIAQATHNTVYQLIFNNMGRVMTRLRAAVPFDQFAPIINQQDLVRLIEALENRDPELAGLLVQRQMERARELVTQLIDKFQQIASTAGTSVS